MTKVFYFLSDNRGLDDQGYTCTVYGYKLVLHVKDITCGIVGQYTEWPFNLISSSDNLVLGIALSNFLKI